MGEGGGGRGGGGVGGISCWNSAHFCRRMYWALSLNLILHGIQIGGNERLLMGIMK